MMEFFGAINNFFVAVSGFLFDWMLLLGQSWALVLIALVTSAILTFVRPWTTNQERLNRCVADKKRLKELIREAKTRKALARQNGDTAAVKAAKEDIARHRLTVGKVAMKQGGAEGKPLLVSIIPLVLVFVWAADRLAYVPPSAGQQVRVLAYFPESDVGQIAYIIPQDGLTAEHDRWMQQIYKQAGEQPNGEAAWVLTGQPRPDQPYRLQIQFDGKLYEKDLLIGARTTAPVQQVYGEDGLLVAELRLDGLRPFGVIPDIPLVPPWHWLIPAWLFAYLLVAVPFVFILRGVFKIR